MTHPTKSETDGLVELARSKGATWQDIADVLGVTRQAVQQRFAKASDGKTVINVVTDLGYPPGTKVYQPPRRPGESLAQWLARFRIVQPEETT